MRWAIVMVMGALALAAALCASLAWFHTRRVELFHAAFFNHCSIRTLQYHWQDARRLRETFTYDFTMSPVSLVMVEVWVIDGPSLSFSREVPLPCRKSFRTDAGALSFLMYTVQTFAALDGKI